MIVVTKFMTVRTSGLSAVVNDGSGTMFMIFKNGGTRSIVYEKVDELMNDYSALSKALEKDGALATTFMTSYMDDLVAVGKNEKNVIFIVFEGGATQGIPYPEDADDDYKKLEDAMEKSAKAK